MAIPDGAGNHVLSENSHAGGYETRVEALSQVFTDDSEKVEPFQKMDLQLYQGNVGVTIQMGRLLFFRERAVIIGNHTQRPSRHACPLGIPYRTESTCSEGTCIAGCPLGIPYRTKSACSEGTCIAGCPLGIPYGMFWLSGRK